MICFICGKQSIKLGKHIQIHDISREEYYNRFYLKGYCLSCGKPTKFLNLTVGYRAYCCPACSNGSVQKISQAKKTCLEKYGDENYNNREQAKETYLKLYGVDNNLKSKEVREKIHNTCIKRYGENYRKVFSKKALSSYRPNIPKYRKTCLERYGVDNTLKLRNRIEQACIQKYGVSSYSKTEEFKELMSSRSIQEKREETFLRLYGVSNYSQTDEWKEKVYLTKKKNNSFNISKQEEYVFSELKKLYPNVIHGYKSGEYPFLCDFYIPEKDLYIECNFHWTHGNHFFEENNPLDIEKLELWKSKNSKYYNNAIKTWTIRDLKKKQYGEKLNYIVFWNIQDFNDWRG